MMKKHHLFLAFLIAITIYFPLSWLWADAVNQIAGNAGRGREPVGTPNATASWKHVSVFPVAATTQIDSQLNTDWGFNVLNIPIGRVLPNSLDAPGSQTKFLYGGAAHYNATSVTPGDSDGGVVTTVLPRIRSVGSNNYNLLLSPNADNLAVDGIQGIAIMGFDGTTYDRIRSTLTGADANSPVGNLSTATALRDGAANTYKWWSAIGSFGDNVGVSDVGIAATALYVFDGNDAYHRLRAVDASTLTATTSIGSPLTVPLSTWSVTSTPAAATQATASRAAGGGTVRHAATTITACFSDTAAEPTATINLRDGATGAGTVLRTWYLGISAANDSKCVDLSGLAMIGTANTAMTLEFAAAGSANSLQTVTLTGFSVP